MFGFFKRRRTEFDLPARAGEVAGNCAAILSLQLMLCRSDEEFASTIRADSTRGYLVGFFDAASQHAGLDFTLPQFLAYLGVGHVTLLKDDVPSASTFVLDSMSLEGTKAFEAGRMAGGTEYFDWMKNQDRQPFGLLRLFHKEALRVDA